MTILVSHQVVPNILQQNCAHEISHNLKEQSTLIDQH